MCRTTHQLTSNARTALYLVGATGQQFQAEYLIDILRGNDNAAVMFNKHDDLAAFGSGRDVDRDRWFGIFDQLINSKFLSVSLGVFRLTAEGFLQAGARNWDRAPLSDDELYERLRSLRKRMAIENAIPTFLIFDNRTLREIAAQRPTTRQQLRSIHGVGDAKLDLYGSHFLDALDEAR